jgi:hypothetical protein
VYANAGRHFLSYANICFLANEGGTWTPQTLTLTEDPSYYCWGGSELHATLTITDQGLFRTVVNCHITTCPSADCTEWNEHDLERTDELDLNTGLFSVSETVSNYTYYLGNCNPEAPPTRIHISEVNERRASGTVDVVTWPRSGLADVPWCH